MHKQTAMNIAQEFNTWQDGYTDKVLRWVPHYQELLHSAAGPPFNHTDPQQVLDLGCGNGNVSALLSAQFPTASFTLLDASEEMLAACEARFGHSSRFERVQAYFETAQFEPQCFDLVVAVLALHHLPASEKKRLFAAIRSWLKPGGVFRYADLFASKNGPHYENEVIADWRSQALQRGTTEEEWAALMQHHERYDFPDTFEDTLAWLRNAGFESVAITWQSGFWGSIAATAPAQ
jgi:ubiquinone/menaquinone biosynthesis C-methylase UbiE